MPGVPVELTRAQRRVLETMEAGTKLQAMKSRGRFLYFLRWGTQLSESELIKAATVDAMRGAGFISHHEPLSHGTYLELTNVGRAAISKPEIS